LTNILIGQTSTDFEPSFIFKSFDIPGHLSKEINYERLLSKPKHKPIIHKFDKSGINTERTVTILTKEDNFNKFDMPWISNLRVKDNSELLRLGRNVTKESTVPIPPSFYDEDLTRFNSKSPRTKNGLIRRNLDVDIEGNTNELQHLILPHDKGSPTRADINFGFGLRKYRSMTGLKAIKPWKNPTAKEAKQFFDAKSAYEESNQNQGNSSFKSPLKFRRRLILKGEGKFNDKFPQRNFNGIRHLFGKTTQIGSIKWGSSLRWNSDKYMFINRRNRMNASSTARNTPSNKKF
jgi:hypothetical protein